MNKIRVALAGGLAVLAASSAVAQGPTPVTGGAVSTFGGQATAPGPRAQQPTPLFMFGGLPFVIWTRVAPPYDATANRNGAENPLP